MGITKNKKKKPVKVLISFRILISYENGNVLSNFVFFSFVFCSTAHKSHIYLSGKIKALKS